MSERLQRKQPDAPSGKELLHSTTVRQISFSIACLEEGLHIPRVVGKLAREAVLAQKDVLVVISDNGSRGALELIEPEHELSVKRENFQKSLRHVSQDGVVDLFKEFTADTTTLRYLQMAILQPNTTFQTTQDFSLLRNHTNTTEAALAAFLSPQLQAQLHEYAQAEDRQRSLLAQAIQHPEEIIQQAEMKKRYHYTNHIQDEPHYEQQREPNEEQKETVRAYAEILSGRFQENPHFRIQLIGGSQSGSFGSARKFGVHAIERDFAMHHPKVNLESHAVIAGFDMDSDFSQGMVQHITTTFQAHPEAKIILPTLDGVEDIGNGEVGESRRSRLVRKIPHHAKLGTFISDFLNGETYFAREGKTSRHYVPKGIVGWAPKIGLPNLQIGPFICVRADALHHAKPMEEVAGQGEDFFATAKLRRMYPLPNQMVHDPHIVLYFNFRGYKLSELLNFFNTSTQDQGVVPFRHKLTRRILGDEKYAQFREGIHGHMHRDELVGELTRRIDETRYQLDPHEYVARQTWNPKHWTRIYRFFNRSQNARVVRATDIALRRDFAAVVVKVPEIVLSQDEYVSKRVTTRKQHQKILRGKHKGERLVTVKGKQYLVRKHFYDREDVADRIRIAQVPR